MPAVRAAYDDDVFCYTSGRWLYNEKHRLKERRLEFNMPALLKAAATSVNRQQDSLRSIRKLAEGGHNRIFELTMKDGFQMIARLPYPLTKPRALAIASEVATMDYLRGHGIPTPLVYSYSASANNPVGAEYILMEKIPGRCLGDVWFDVSDKQRVRILGDIVDQEANLFKISFPAYGSIYYDADLPEHMSRTMMERQFCIGPDVSLRHWFEARSELDIRRGSASTPLDVLEDGAKREMAWLQGHGRQRFTFERVYREMFDYKKVEPSEHLRNLESFLRVAAHLVPEDEWLHKPTLRHPDLNPNNLLVDKDCKIISIIDWQHSNVLPLFLNAGIPASIQNYGDPVSEELSMPELPSNLDELDDNERQQDMELYRRRHTHFYYVGATATKLDAHYKAMAQDKALFRKKIYQNASAPWEGNSIPLKADMILLARNWPLLARSKENMPTQCPISFDEQEAEDTITKILEQENIDRQMGILRDAIGIGSDGWVPHDRYDDAVAQATAVKEDALRDADDEAERGMILRHWPFEDHDEDE